MTFLRILYIAIIISVVFLEHKKPAEAVLWLVVMLLLPGVGALLYLVLGSTLGIKLNTYIRSKKLVDHVNVPLNASLKQSKNENFLAAVDLSQRDKAVISFNLNYNQSPLVFCSKAEVFTSGATHYKALFEDIQNAKEQILVEFYTIHNDQIGQTLVAALTEKAKQGVRVKVLCDFIANVATPPKMFAPLKKAGGQVHRVKPFFTHYRNHRKIVVIDGNIGYIGGMNIGKQYVNFSKKKPWRDTQVRITGPSVTMLRYYFLKDWVSAINRKKFLQLEDSFYQMAAGDQHQAYAFDPKQMPCQFVIGGVDTTDEAMKMTYLSLFKSATQRIRIQSPYFIPDSSTLDALKVAAASGIEIEIMIPGISASFFLTPVTRWYIGQMLALGAKVYQYEGYMHAKTVIIDDEITCIGSVNLDMRSLLVDDEICGLFYSNAFTKEYIATFDQDIKNSRPYTLETFEKRGLFNRFQERFFLLFAPLM